MGAGFGGGWQAELGVANNPPPSRLGDRSILRSRLPSFSLSFKSLYGDVQWIRVSTANLPAKWIDQYGCGLVASPGMWSRGARQLRSLLLLLLLVQVLVSFTQAGRLAFSSRHLFVSLRKSDSRPQPFGSTSSRPRPAHCR